MSESAKIFWGSIVRHILTAICGALVLHGYVSQTGANAYIEELVGVVLWGLPVVWARRAHYWEMIRQIVARQLPAGASAGDVNGKIASMKAIGMPMPSVKALGFLLAVALTGFSLSACASIPAGLPPNSQAVATANEVVVALGTLQRAAIELNKVQDCGGVVVIRPCQPLLSTANTTIVVDAVTDALTTLRATPGGWKAIASAALTRLQGRLDAAGKGKLSAYVNALKSVAGL